jgi:hypothetical protein
MEAVITVPATVGVLAPEEPEDINPPETRQMDLVSAANRARITSSLIRDSTQII